jgi:hypothetical protein
MASPSLFVRGTGRIQAKGLVERLESDAGSLDPGSPQLGQQLASPPEREKEDLWSPWEGLGVRMVSPRSWTCRKRDPGCLLTSGPIWDQVSLASRKRTSKVRETATM